MQWDRNCYNIPMLKFHHARHTFSSFLLKITLLPNTDHLQQVVIMSEDAHDNWKVKTIYWFHNLVFDEGNSSLECFYRATQN
jgi:hypothetical protein